MLAEWVFICFCVHNWRGRSLDVKKVYYKMEYKNVFLFDSCVDSRGSIWVYGYTAEFKKYALRLINVPITCNVAIDIDYFSQSGSEYMTSGCNAHIS
jgi:hypothetical protein